MRPGDICPQCNASHIRVRYTRRLVDGRFRQRFLFCDHCGHDGTQTVPIDSHGREMLAHKHKIVVCGCCGNTIEVDADNNSNP